MKTLLIDDVRDLQADLIARNYLMGIKALERMGPWTLLMLDHDLASTGDGTMVCLFLEKNPELRPEEIELVTANPVGRERMQQILEGMGYQPSAGRLHWKLPV